MHEPTPFYSLPVQTFLSGKTSFPARIQGIRAPSLRAPSRGLLFLLFASPPLGVPNQQKWNASGRGGPGKKRPKQTFVKLGTLECRACDISTTVRTDLRSCFVLLFVAVLYIICYQGWRESVNKSLFPDMHSEARGPLGAKCGKCGNPKLCGKCGKCGKMRKIWTPRGPLRSPRTP